MPVNSGPIPGENYTSDTKNYPWRQPPEFSDIDEALDWVSGRLTQFKVANGILTMAETGVPLYQITNFILLNYVGEGKWTPDFSLLLAGPVCRMIELMCIGFDVEYDLGIEDDDDDFETGTFFKNESDMKFAKGIELLNEEMPNIKAQAEEPSPEGENLKSQGFMAMQGNPTETKQEGAK